VKKPHVLSQPGVGVDNSRTDGATIPPHESRIDLPRHLQGEFFDRIWEKSRVWVGPDCSVVHASASCTVLRSNIATVVTPTPPSPGVRQGNQTEDVNPGRFGS
jgi:hypothetical protein